MEDVDDNLQVIEHDPLAGGKTVDRRRAYAMIFPQPRLDFAGNRFQVRFRRPRADDEEIRKGRNFAQIKDHDAFRLFVGGELRTGFR